MPSRKTPDPISSQSNLDENIEKFVQESASDLYGRNNRPYDGVLGIPSGWIPENFQREFKEARNKLLDAGYKPNQVRDFISKEFRSNRKALRNPTKAVSYDGFLWPLTVWRDVRFLAHIRTADRLGPEKGLAFLTDPAHASKVKKGEQYGKHQSRVAKNPRGKIEEAEGKTINEMIGRLAKARPDESAKELWSHFHSELDGHTVNPKMDDQRGAISYDFNSKRKSITFGTFEKVVSRYRTGREKLP